MASRTYLAAGFHKDSGARLSVDFSGGGIQPLPAAGSAAVYVDRAPIPAPRSSPGLNPDANLITCFASGTRICSAAGATLVEELKIGDMVRTIDGRDVAVKWIGRQTVAPRAMPVEPVRPVTFAVGSLGGGLPTSELTVPAAQAILLGDTLCNAGALVNGATITRVAPEEMAGVVTFFHVETEEHEIILANGAAAETFADNLSRSVFDNFSEFQELYGAVGEMADLGYPRAHRTHQVPTAIRAMLSAQEAA